MAGRSVTYSLSLSQEQLQGFVEFCDSFEELLFRHYVSIPHGAAKLKQWQQAYLLACFIKIVHSMFPAVGHNFELNAEHARGLKEILEIADDFLYSELPQKIRTAKNDELYQRCVSSFELFSETVKTALKQTK